MQIGRTPYSLVIVVIAYIIRNLGYKYFYYNDKLCCLLLYVPPASTLYMRYTQDDTSVIDAHHNYIGHIFPAHQFVQQ